MSRAHEISSCFGLGATILLGALLAPQSAQCGSAPITTVQEVDAEFGYVGGSTTTSDGRDIGSVDEWNAGLSYVISPQLNRRLFLRCGAQWRRFSFGVPEGALLPEELQQINAIIGFDWQASDKWLVRAELQPGVYSDFQEVTWRDVSAPLILGAVYLANADLQWMFGLRVVPRSAYPVLPAVGVRWRFAPEWTMNLFMPDPRLEYDLNDRLKAYVGASFKVGTFMLGDHFGEDHGQPGFNHAILDYFEVLVGPGISWKIRPNLTLDVNAGCLVYRGFNFSDSDLIARSQPAPYVQIACHWLF
jgi:hypothetical protein